MILNDTEIETRLESPLNLINKLRDIKVKNEAMSIFKPSVGAEPELDNSELPAAILDNDKIKAGLIKSRATDILHDSLVELSGRLGEVSKVKDLSMIAKDMKMILTEDESKYKNQNNIIIYKPVVNDISKYETLVVME